MNIRWVILLAALTVLPFTAANAQLSYGAKLGMGFPGFTNDSIASQRITLAVALSGGLKINDFLQLTTEVGYQRKGNRHSSVYNPVGQVTKDSTFVKTNLDYLVIPLLLRVNLGQSSKFYFQAGGYYGYLLHANYTGYKGSDYVTREPVRDLLLSSDYGVIAGGGIETPIRPGLGVILDVRYQYGLRDISTNPLFSVNGVPMRNKGLSLSMGFYMDIE